MFEPGQFVLCVDDSPGYLTRDRSDIKRGAIYTIAEVFPPATIEEHQWGVTLRELSVPEDTCMDARRFRPLPDERLAVFRSMLQPTELERLEFISEDIADDIVELERSWRK